MAELHVQPKRNNFWWLWLLLAIIIIAGLFYYFNYYQKGKTLDMGITKDSTTNSTSDTTVIGTSPNANLWDQIDFNSPDTAYPEITDKNVVTRSNAHFVIYTADVQNLFSDDKNDLSTGGKKSLDQIASSINQRFNSADVRIYAQSDTAHIDSLALQRSDSIKNYLVKNSNIDQSRITIYHPGEGTSVPGKKNTVNIVVKR